jgi:hypothetical protein
MVADFGGYHVSTEVGRCELNPVDPQLETARLQPLSLPLDPS